MYGWRGRIGVIIPATNTTVESEFGRLAGEGLSVHASRIPTREEVTIETLEDMVRDSKDAAVRVAQCKPDVVVFACTSATFLKGSEWAAEIVEELSSVTGCPVVTTTSAFTEALATVGAKSVDVVTPYISVTNERLVKYFKQSGIEVNCLRTFDMLNQFDHGAIQPEEIYQLAKEANTGSSDAVFVACTQLRALEVLDQLEGDLNKPVLSAVQTTWWKTLRTLGITLQHTEGGSLLATQK